LSKEELLEKVWAGQFVEENNLTVYISALRKILGEKKGENSFIATVPGKGYKFVADVENSDDGEKEISIESRTISRILIEDYETTDEADSGKVEFENKSLEAGGLPRRRAGFSPVIVYSAIAAGLLLVACDRRALFARKQVSDYGKIKRADEIR